MEESPDTKSEIVSMYRTLALDDKSVRSSEPTPKLGRKRSTSELNLKEWEKEHGSTEVGIGLEEKEETRKKAEYYCTAHIEKLLTKSRHLNMALLEVAMVTGNPEIGKYLVLVLEANTGKNKSEFLNVVNWVCERCIQDITQSELLFREESACTKFISETLFQEGTQFLHGFLKKILKHVTDSSSQSYEIDPDREMNEDVRLQNHDALVEVCLAGIQYIDANAKKLSAATTEIFSRTFYSTMSKFGTEVANTCLTGLFFLRYVCPVLVNPEKFGNKPPSAEERKKLITVSRLLQIFANRVKEPAPHHAAVVNEIGAKYPQFLENLIGNIIRISTKSFPTFLSLSLNVDDIVNESAKEMLQFTMDNKETIASVLTSYAGRKRSSSDVPHKEKKRSSLTNSLKKVVRLGSGGKSKPVIGEDLSYDDAISSLENITSYTCHCKPNNYRVVYSQIESAMQSLKF